MSHNLTFATQIKDRELLAAACDRLRQRPGCSEVVGPRYKENVPTRKGGNMSGYAVRLPDWNKDAMFACDETGEMEADNYSPYFDNRDVDNAGNRIPGTGDVHPLVLSGDKRVGEEGRWGDISYLEMLEDEYIAAAYEDVAQSMGHQMTSEVDADGALLLEIEI